MRFVASVFMLVAVAAFTSACCCDPLSLLNLCTPNAAPTAQASEFHAVKTHQATQTAATTPLSASAQSF